MWYSLIWLTMLGKSAGRCLGVMGVFTTANDVPQRDLHRRYLSRFSSTAFGSCEPNQSKILVRFILCSKTLTNELIGEQKEHMDLIVLPSSENMNDGKTLDYFALMARSSFDADFILKADIDAFVHVDNLVSVLVRFKNPRQEFAYYGRVIGRFPVPDHGWIMGCLYGMTYNLVQHFAAVAETRSMSLRGGEDKVSTRIAAKVASSTNQTCTWITDNYIHDHPDCGCGPNAVPFSAKTVAVHQLKAYSLWNSTLQYFFGANETFHIMQGLQTRNFPGLQYRTCKRIMD